MIASLVYILCGLTSGLCALLLFRMYRRSGARLLMWSALSFVWWTVANALVFADFVVWPDADLAVFRSVAGCIAIALLLFGLIWDSE
jgi:hypothetical protein